MNQIEPSPRPLAYRVDSLHKIAPWGRSTTYKLIRDGRLRVKRIGGMTFVLADEFDKFLAGLEEVQAELREQLGQDAG